MSESASNLDALGALLSPEESVKAKKFHFKKDQDNFIVRRACLRILLGKYMDVPPNTLAFTTGTNKRPVLDSQHKQGPFFNLSHTDDMILIGISDHEIGVDIEKISPDLNYQEIMAHSFASQEIDLIVNSDKPLFTFYSIWTRKEAILKACSKGILGDLKEIKCLDGVQSGNMNLVKDSWFISSFHFHESYSASIASPINCVPEFLYLLLPKLLKN